MGYIYKITNQLNGKIYIGQTIRKPEYRWYEHINNAYNSNRRDKMAITQAIAKYGEENFQFEVIEECDNNQLNEREQYYIHYYHSLQDGYNSTPGGDSNYNLQKAIIVYQWDLDGNFVKKWNSAREVENMYGWGHGEILKCCRGEKGHNSRYGYLWSFTDTAPSFRCNQSFKKVACMNNNKEIVKIYNKIADAEKELNIPSTHISRACKRGIRAGGYYWEYIEKEKTNNAET